MKSFTDYRRELADRCANLRPRVDRGAIRRSSRQLELPLMPAASSTSKKGRENRRRRGAGGGNDPAAGH
jgi:hypothetical protein